MIIRGVLLATIEEQRAGGDDDPVDPTAFSNLDESVPVNIQFDQNRVIGNTIRMWIEDDRLLFEAELAPNDLTKERPSDYPTAAVGFIADRKNGKGELLEGDLQPLAKAELVERATSTVTNAQMFAVGLTAKNQNRDQPVWSASPDNWRPLPKHDPR
jgi:hypothetical protein